MAEEYTTKIKIEADTAGAAKASKAFEDAEKKAKGLGTALGGVRKAAGLLRSALMGFGVVGIFTSLIGVVENLRKKFGETKDEADKLRTAAEKATDTERVEKLTAGYDKLAKSIDAAAKARERANELEDMEKNSARELEDIEATAAKDAELSALDPNDRYYEQKKAQIEAKYGAAAANRTAQRKVEDAETAAARTQAEAEAKSVEAGDRRVALIGDRAQLDMMKKRRSAALAESVSDNAGDLSGAGETGWVNFTRVFGMNGGWKRLGESRTEEGDAKRKAAEDKAAELEKQIKAKEKDIADKEAKIAALEEEAAHLSKKSVIQSGIAENAKDAASVTRAAGYRSETAAAGALSGQIAAETDAARAKQLMEAEKARIQQQLAAEQQRKADAGAAVFMAQGALSEAKANNDRGGTAAAAQQLAAAQEAANSVGLSADRAINALTEKLKQVEAILNKATSAISKNNSQRLTAQAEALTTN